MARSFRDASRTFADRALQLRQLQDQREQRSLANTVKMAELEREGVTFQQQVTPGKRFLGIPITPNRKSLTYSYDPSKAIENLSPSERINRERFKQQMGYDPITNERLSEDELVTPRYGYKDDPLDSFIAQSGNNGEPKQLAAASPMPAYGKRKFAGSSENNYLNERDHYNQLRAAGYSANDARKMAGL